jgi:hypothetical protein
MIDDSEDVGAEDEPAFNHEAFRPIAGLNSLPEDNEYKL